MTSLADLAAGQRGFVTDVTGNDSLSLRIMEFGILEGESILLIGRAPLGDPIEVSVRGAKLSLRKAEAQRVLVKIIDPQRGGSEK
ncbi:MAG: ferrous iron transport protein A [Planctomycetales bacterium]|nr:ferrous iron transport protein A [Planctomycetales bacterium]